MQVWGYEFERNWLIKAILIKTKWMGEMLSEITTIFLYTRQKIYHMEKCLFIVAVSSILFLVAEVVKECVYVAMFSLALISWLSDLFFNPFVTFLSHSWWGIWWAMLPVWLGSWWYCRRPWKRHDIQDWSGSQSLWSTLHWRHRTVSFCLPGEGIASSLPTCHCQRSTKKQAHSQTRHSQGKIHM